MKIVYVKSRVRKQEDSFYDRIAKLEPMALDDRYFGGVYGCPGHYFRGAPTTGMNGCLAGPSPLSHSVGGGTCRECWRRSADNHPWIGKRGNRDA